MLDQLVVRACDRRPGHSGVSVPFGAPTERRLIPRSLSLGRQRVDTVLVDLFDPNPDEPVTVVVDVTKVAVENR